MAQHRKREEYLNDAIEAVRKHKLFFITDVPAMIGLSTSRFYQLELEKVEDIKQALIANRVEVKSSMRNKWYKSENATLQMGLYKLIGSEDEYHRLSNTKIDLSVSEKAPFEGLDLSDADKATE